MNDYFGQIEIYLISVNVVKAVADYTQACKLIEGIDAEYLLADKRYASDALVDSVQHAE